ncbi:MAG: hypothetical protein L0322_16975 [Chloroflexi bacterium]|nr:hypothetical protein [Chloroflexota bacterium]
MERLKRTLMADKLRPKSHLLSINLGKARPVEQTILPAFKQAGKMVDFTLKTWHNELQNKSPAHCG